MWVYNKHNSILWACISTRSVPCSSSHLSGCMSGAVAVRTVRLAGLRSAEGRSMHFLYYSYCANEHPPMGLNRSPQSFFSTFTWSNEQCMRSLFILMLLFIIDVLCFSPRGEMEREDCCVLVSFDSLNSVCVQIQLVQTPARGNPTRPCTPALSHRRDRQYKMSGKKQTHTWIWGRPGALRACFGLVT